MGEGAFAGCSGMTSIKVDLQNPRYYSRDNCVIERDIERLVVGIQTSRIPDQVRYIGDSAFCGCRGLVSMTIPTNVASIGRGAFCACSELTSVIIPNSVVYIDRDAFSKCSKATIYCEHPSKPSLWNHDWNHDSCPVQWNAQIGADALNRTLSQMASSKLYSHGLTYEKLDDGTYAVTGMGNCRDDRLLIPSTTPEGCVVKRISHNAFSGCRFIKEVVIPEGIEYIGSYSFYGCTSLKKIKIGNGVKLIGNCAFC
jgi:hypothetical protein